MNNNPSPGNKAGGLTTILEKSLGAVAKGGTTNLVDVYEYAEPVTAHGLRLHGYAGLRPGLGHRPGRRRRQRDLLHHRPRLGLRLQARALAQARDQHAALRARRKTTWTSTAATIIDGTETIAQVGERFFQLILDTASGSKTKSESIRLRRRRVRALDARRDYVIMNLPTRHRHRARLGRGTARLCGDLRRRPRRRDGLGRAAGPSRRAPASARDRARAAS